MIGRFLGEAFWVLSCPFWNTVLECGARLPIHTLNCWTVLVGRARFLTGDEFSVTLLIVDPWQYCIRSGATRCTILMVLYLEPMC